MVIEDYEEETEHQNMDDYIPESSQSSDEEPQLNVPILNHCIPICVYVEAKRSYHQYEDEVTIRIVYLNLVIPRTSSRGKKMVFVPPLRIYERYEETV